LFATTRGNDTENKPSHEVLNETLTWICFGRYDPLSKMTAMLQVNKQFLPDDRYGHSMHCLSPWSGNTRARHSSFCLKTASSTECHWLSRELWGRSSCHRNGSRRVPYKAQNDLDAIVHRILGAFCLLRLEEGNLR
jgi:hypothetical protein